MLNWFRRKNTEIADTPDKIQSLLSALSWATDSGITVTPANAMQIATVFACVRVLAESVGMLPLNLMVERGRNRDKDTGNRIQQLMVRGPNDFMTAQEWKECVITHLALRGNHYSYISRVGGQVRELLPLNPAAVEPKIADDWTVTYKVTFKNGTVAVLGQDEILHIRLFSNDGINGLSPIAWARNSVALAKAAERHGGKFFANSAQASGGYKTAAKLNDDQYNRLRDALDSMTGEGAHRGLILEGGLEWFQTTMTAADAQFLETRKFQRGDICAIFRVPPHMVADLEKATFSNIEHQALEFVQHTLMPYLTRIEQRLAKSLLKDDMSRYFKFNANALLRGDMKARAEFYSKQLQNGAMSPNEIRDLEDMNPRDGGDIYLTPMNMVTESERERNANEAAV
jgi:HK97 family phage portal protein